MVHHLVEQMQHVPESKLQRGKAHSTAEKAMCLCTCSGEDFSVKTTLNTGNMLCGFQSTLETSV